MKNFKKELLDKVINNIKKGFIDNDFIFINPFTNIKYNKLEIESSKDIICFYTYTYLYNIKTYKCYIDNETCFLLDFNKYYIDDQFFKYVIDYLYNIEEVKYNKEILENNFKQTNNIKTNRI